MAELAAVESYSPHPLAQAMVARIGGLPRPTATDVIAHPALGIGGGVGETRYFIGN